MAEEEVVVAKRRDYRGQAERDGILKARVGRVRRERFLELARREGLTATEALRRLVTWAILEGRLPSE